VKLPFVAFILVLVLLGAIGFVEFSGRHAKPRNPHILLVVLDTVRADHVSLGLEPGERDTTPFLRSIAERGTVFTAARAPANWTLPSHASMFTGLTPSEHGCHFEHRYLADDAFTIAEVLRQREYVTAGFSSNVNVSRLFNLDQGFDEFYETWNDEEVRQGRRPTQALADHLVAWAAKNKNRPAFAFVNLMDAHLPYDAAPGFEDHFGQAGSAIDRDIVAAPDFLEQVLAGEIDLDPSFTDALAERYDNAIRGLDAELRSSFERLEEVGFLEDAIVIVTSDHGENLGDHGLVDHQGSLSESVLRVPLVIRGPGISVGRRVDHPVSLTRLFRFLQDLSHPSYQGLGIPERPWRGPILSERMQPIEVLERMAATRPEVDMTEFSRRGTAMVIPGEPWKLLVAEGGAPSLHAWGDMPADEGPDVAAQNPDAAKSFEGRLEGALASRRWLRETLAPEEVSAPDTEAIAELERLGYTSGRMANPGSVHAQEHLNRGVRAAAAGDFFAAREEFRAAVALEPGFADGLFNLALAAEKIAPAPPTQQLIDAWERYLSVAHKTPGQSQESIQYALRRLEELRSHGQANN